ncbi:uncharacterized protein LOC117315674 [Pecten maximus]|uniref:uncharacterized protein LOC117315674 n=1 Tax=Pecten maximus TaxID=6579 RepID=UPI001458FD29|nr:uncharacterized protein LOC117315674 [Pecten maximus]
MDQPYASTSKKRKRGPYGSKKGSDEDKDFQCMNLVVKEDHRLQSTINIVSPIASHLSAEQTVQDDNQGCVTTVDDKQLTQTDDDDDDDEISSADDHDERCRVTDENIFVEHENVLKNTPQKPAGANSDVQDSLTHEAMDTFFSKMEDKDLDDDIDDLIDQMLHDNQLRNQENLVNDEQTAVILEERVEVLRQITEIFTDSEESKNPANDESTGSSKLFPDSPYSLGLLVLLICCFLIRFRLPDEAAAYMLKIFAAVLPQGHSLFRSLYHLRKFIKKFTEDMFPTLHYYCSSCYSKVEKNDKVCISCRKDLTKSGGVAYFVHLKLISQLRALWKTQDFVNDVRNHRFQHIKNNKNGNLKDVYDGQLYKNLFENGILQEENNLSFSLNTDGAPLFKSSNVSMWPVYMLINELPIAKRKHRQNSVFYGVWISSKKPQMWSFLQPLYSELKHLETEGETFEDCDGNSFLCKCFLLTCTCDLPARAMVYNVNQYNGDFSCWFCLHKGETLKLDTGGIVHIFPYNSSNPKGIPRTKESILEDLTKVQTNVENGVKKFTVHGHKGPFWFLYLTYFNAVYSCVIDYMHGICLGTTKQLMNLWFGASNKSKPYSVYHAKQTVNKFLSEIRPTLFVTRVPRLIDDIAHWKSSEFRNFLLYWGIPVMSKILRKEYFVHFCLLARAIFLLSMENISPVDIATAEGALLLFVENFERLYEARYTTLNLHQLIHLVDCVRHTGPLFVNNCFIFEDLNGYIIKHVHGTQGVENQLVNIIGLVKAIPIMYDRYFKGIDDCDYVFELYHELSDSIASRRIHKHEIEDGIVRVGNLFNGELSDDEFAAISNYGVQCTRNVSKYYNINMYKKGFYVYGKLYKNLVKRQQHVITFFHENDYKFGSVVYFMESNDKTGNKINLALVEPMKKVKSVGSVWKIEFRKSCIAIPLKCITNINNFVGITGDFFVCPPPNRYDRD